MKGIVNNNLAFKIMSRNLFIIAGSLLLCMVVAIIYQESIWPFLLSFLIACSLGLLLAFVTRHQSMNIVIYRKNAYFAVTLSWLVISLVGSLPFLFQGTMPTVVDAIFESVSGFTTTGSSILTDIEALPKSILFWRSMTHWIGGIGIIVLVIIVMPTLQIGGYNLFTLESSLQEKIKPKIKLVGYRLLIIYLLLTTAEVLLLLAGHMNLFESICHAFGTVATGGFSPKNTSITDYSPYIQYVIMVFMLLSGINFVIHYYLMKREFSKVKNNEELWMYLGIIFIIGGIVTLLLYNTGSRSFELSFREAFFQVVSIITTTGFASADYLNWPSAAWILIYFSLFIGGSTGSTAGGIKVARFLVIYKNLARTFRQSLSSNAIFPIRLNNSRLNENANHSIIVFVQTYILLFIIGSFILVLLGVDARTSSSSVATCMAGIGPGIGTVGPASNFAHLPILAKILLIFIMIAGRLEIFTFVMVFTRGFWRKSF